MHGFNTIIVMKKVPSTWTKFWANCGNLLSCTLVYLDDLFENKWKIGNKPGKLFDSLIELFGDLNYVFVLCIAVFSEWHNIKNFQYIDIGI